VLTFVGVMFVAQTLGPVDIVDLDAVDLPPRLVCDICACAPPSVRQGGTVGLAGRDVAVVIIVIVGPRGQRWDGPYWGFGAPKYDALLTPVSAVCVDNFLV
jgi:hypothetical protein